MSIGTVSRGRHRIVVEFDPTLADAIERSIQERSTPYRRVTASDIIREAVARLLLPSDAIISGHLETNSSALSNQGGSH